MTDPKPTDPNTPPWGDDFDAARAWQTITTLRAEVTDYKGKLVAAETARDEFETKATAAEAALATAADEHATALSGAQRDLFVERAIRTHGVPDDLVDFLTGDDEDAINAKAERLAKVGQPAPKADEQEDPKPNPATRPEPALLPGHGADPAEPFDAAKVAAEIRASR